MKKTKPTPSIHGCVFIGSWEKNVFTTVKSQTQHKVLMRFDHRWKWNNTQEWREKEKKERERRRIADFIHWFLCELLCCVWQQLLFHFRVSKRTLTELLSDTHFHLFSLHPFCFFFFPFSEWYSCNFSQISDSGTSLPYQLPLLDPLLYRVSVE